MKATFRHLGLLLSFLILFGACVAPAGNTGQGAAGGAAASEPTVINVYSDDDTNITDWLTNSVIPAFEAQYPQYKVNFVNVRDAGDGVKTIADRSLAAKETNADPQAEVLGFDSRDYPDLVDAGLWEALDETKIPNAKNIVEAARVTDYSMAYRGSQVLIAYDSAKIPENEVPKTFADLIAWVKAHPGQFAYCRPDKGGSGGNFVTRAIYEVTGKDPSKFKPGTPDPALLQEYDKAWELLREIHPAIYDNGSYPAGNNPTLQLLANGSVSMISAWSDQAIQALNKGVLPENIKLLQFTDLPMPGGYALFSVPSNAKNKQGAFDFINFMLTPEMQASVVTEIGGFPAVDWSLMSDELQSQFTSVITSNVPSWPGGEYDAVKVKGWYENVATNMKQGE